MPPPLFFQPLFIWFWPIVASLDVSPWGVREKKRCQLAHFALSLSFNTRWIRQFFTLRCVIAADQSQGLFFRELPF
ncbi:hypothetical protein BC940DRAFT_51419 [Gongronella butleri]|nr:hypothetical protein BC940DRAFT_51419 [Gongronella butleri]